MQITKKRYSWILIIILLSLFLKPELSRAEILKLHLYFDSSKNEIVEDREAAEKIEFINEPYEDLPETQDELSDYYFKIIDAQNGSSDPIYFTPASGQFTLDVPYIQEIAKVEIYYNDTRQLSIDTSSLATCNANKACESDRGENAQNCISDCFSLEVERIKGSSNTNEDLEDGEPLRNSNKNTNSQSTTPTRIPYFGLIVGVGMIVGGIGYGVYRLVKRYRDKE